MEEGYHLLVGADGASSAVREHMQEQVPGFAVRQLYRSNAQYKTFHGLPLAGPDDGVPPLLAGIEGHQHVYWWERTRTRTHTHAPVSSRQLQRLCRPDSHLDSYGCPWKRRR